MWIGFVYQTSTTGRF